MNSENETALTTDKDKDPPTELQKCNIESEVDSNKGNSNVEKTELNLDMHNNSEDASEADNEHSIETEKDQLSVQTIDSHIKENAVSIPPNSPEQKTTNQFEESNALKNDSTEPRLDGAASCPAENYEQSNKECKTPEFESNSVPETVCEMSKGLGVLSDVESQDSVEQQSRSKETENSVSRTNVGEDSTFRLNAEDDSESRMNMDNDSVSKTNLDDVDSNLGTKESKNSNAADNDQADKKESTQVPDASNLDSPKPMEIDSCELDIAMDVTTINKESKSNETTYDIEKDVIPDITNIEKSNEISEDTLECDKSPMVLDEISDAADTENASEKNSDERVNTEFVQITQDKQDDSQIESHSMDAEDPFGGDNLITDNSEEMETEGISKSKADFEKLGSLADNETASSHYEKDKSDLESSPKPNDSAGTTSSETNNETKPDSPVTEIINESEKEGEKSSETVETKSTYPGDEKDKSDEQEKQKDKTISSVENEPSVLPGQDDELCIIPDSMKDMEVDKKADEADTNKSVEAIKNTRENKQGDPEKQAKLAVTIFKDAKETTTNADASTEVPIQELPTIQHTIEVSQSITDIIDVEEDSEKSSEVEEISSSESCKQCNEVKNCKLKVKVGTELFSVCSKACKSAFKSANNKAMDIPSDGVNSKREKRCASCLLIIEPGDERCLSWETMEFCNEECLGKFQTKYGSYCRNCNGSVQAVSLGKYCVRFGYDVRQFCCSICLEEFKKGLKVCTYCQKDISAGTEGFLAPVGDKGQFKDFCTQDCMEKYSRMSSTEPPLVEKKACSVCQEV